MTRSFSIFLFAGDFADVLRRYDAGEEQVYGAHDEVARLIHDLRNAGIAVTVYSFVTPEAGEEVPLDGVRIVSLGGNSYRDHHLLLDALARDRSDAVVVQFHSRPLLAAAIRSGKRVMAVLATSSFIRRGIKHRLSTWRLVRLLNHPRIEIVSNHCGPATDLLAQEGVSRDKLIPWNVPQRYNPRDYSAKRLGEKDSFVVAYAGAVYRSKGVFDLIQALIRLNREGIKVRGVIAGGGPGLEDARSLGADVADFPGVIPNAQVFDLFRNADLVAIPSWHELGEGMPLVTFEALASRTPIVCSDQPVLRPILTGRSSMFKARDVKEFAAAIRAPLADPELYARLSEQAVESWEKLARTEDWRAMVYSWATGEPARRADEVRGRMIAHGSDLRHA